jgi:protein-S-isoprenylcysteine O-methyltransferase Ste14
LSIRAGAFFFRNRGWIPVPVVLLLLAFARPTPPAFVAGLVLTLAGETLRIRAAMHIGPRSRTRDASVGELASGGPYRFCRNPLYVANLALYAAVALFSGRVFGLAFPVFMALVYSAVVRWEETRLLTGHGADYAAFCRVIPRWIGLRPGLPPRAARTDFPGALRAERGTLVVALAVVGAFALRAS